MDRAHVRRIELADAVPARANDNLRFTAMELDAQPVVVPAAGHRWLAAGEGRADWVGPGVVSGDPAEEPVRLVVRSGRVVQCIRVPGGGAVAEGQAPEAVDDHRVAPRFHEGTESFAGIRIKGIDPAVSEVADEYRSAEVAERRRRLHHPPRGIEHV